MTATAKAFRPLIAHEVNPVLEGDNHVTCLVVDNDASLHRHARTRTLIALNESVRPVALLLLASDPICLILKQELCHG